jgi:hypothetical protein
MEYSSLCSQSPHCVGLRGCSLGSTRGSHHRAIVSKLFWNASDCFRWCFILLCAMFYVASYDVFILLRSMFLYCFWLCFYIALDDVFILLWTMFYIASVYVLYCFWLCFYNALYDVFILLWTMFYIASVDVFILLRSMFYIAFDYVFILLWTMFLFCFGRCFILLRSMFLYCFGRCFYIAFDYVFILLWTMFLYCFVRLFIFLWMIFLYDTSTRRVFRKGGTIIYPRGGINFNPPLGWQAELKRQYPQADCVSRAPSILTWLGLLLYSIITCRGFCSPSELCRNIAASSNTGLRQSKEHVRSRRMKPAYKCIMLPVVCPRWCMYIQMRLFVKYVKQSCSL